MPKKGRFSLKPLAVVLVMAALAPLAAQAAIPNMKGTWSLVSAQGVRYDNVLDQANTPSFFTASSGDLFYVTDQQGRAFAGYAIDGQTKVFLVGVIETDNTISIQTHNTYSKQFIDVKYSIVNTKPTLKGYFQGFSHLHNNPVTAFIEAIYFEARKTSSSVPVH